MFEISNTIRLRRSPYYQATVEAGVKSFSPYNSMLLPTGYGDPEAEYWRLINGVSQWDVAVERQVEICGPDAANLVQILSPRDLSTCVENQGKYVPLCNHAGTIINDPILLKLKSDKFWFSIADSNILFWARAIAAERGLKVTIVEPDVSPMAVQGPDAENVIAELLGEWVRELKYFWFQSVEISNIPFLLSRSGWSKQGGFELYLMEGSKGYELWNIVKEAGQPYAIGPGNPDACERIESGLLSWGADTDDDTNPFEVRLGNYVDTDLPDDIVGVKSLRTIKANGPKRHQLGIKLHDDEPFSSHLVWYDILQEGRKVGDMTNGIWSRRLNCNIGFALISRECKVGQSVTVDRQGKQVSGELCKLPFI